MLAADAAVVIEMAAAVVAEDDDDDEFAIVAGLVGCRLLLVVAEVPTPAAVDGSDASALATDC